MSDRPPPDIAESNRRTRLAVLASMGAAAILGLCVACGRKAEKPSPAASSAEVAAPWEATPAPATPTVGTEDAPSFTEKAAAGEEPYAAATSPLDGAVDGRGRLWVLDSAHNHLRVFDDKGGYLGGWGGSADKGKYSFRSPEGIAFAGNTLYVCDTWSNEVRAYSLKGEPTGRATGLYGPRGVAAGPGSVWVTDTGNSRVMAYGADLSNPHEIGKAGSRPGEFNGPVGIAYSPAGRIFIADSGNGRIQVLSKEGRFVASWSLPWLKKSWQAHVAVDAKGTVYVSNPEAGEILSFDASGHPQAKWTGDGAGTTLAHPIGVAVGPGALYVMDDRLHKVVKIGLPGAVAR